MIASLAGSVLEMDSPLGLVSLIFACSVDFSVPLNVIDRFSACEVCMWTCSLSTSPSAVGIPFLWLHHFRLGLYLVFDWPYGAGEF